MESSGYRLGWYACLALVLLRVAIGWHFLVEGLWKIDSRRVGDKPFSAEGYIANSSGPLRPWFRAQLDDPDGLERLDPAGIPNRWERTFTELHRRYHLTPEQEQSARAKIEQLKQAKENYFEDPANQAKLNAYREEIERIRQDERGNPDFVPEQAKDRLKALAKMRDDLLAPVNAWTASLREHITSELTPEQLERSSTEPIGGLAALLHLPFKLEWPEQKVERINMVTMLGLTACGGLLLIGLFSRFAALGAAAFLAAFYACNPAPPLGITAPGDMGHYLYVNKELIECLAALVLVTIPTGRWLGLDAIVHALTHRARKGMSRSQPLLS